MLRIAIVCAVALSLAGCESDVDFWQPVTDGTWLSGDAQPAAEPAAQTTDDAHCQAVAYARAADARANGYDDDLRDTVYSGTYAECTAWDKQHGQSQPN